MLPIPIQQHLLAQRMKEVLFRKYSDNHLQLSRDGKLPANETGKRIRVCTYTYIRMHRYRATVKWRRTLNRSRTVKLKKKGGRCIAENRIFSKRLTPVLLVARCPATRWRHRSRW